MSVDADVHPAEMIGICLRVFQPPLIPESDSLFKHREMFGIRRGASKSVGPAVCNDTLALDCPAIIRRLDESKRDSRLGNEAGWLLTLR